MKKLMEMIKNYKMKKMEVAAEVKKIHIQEIIKKLYQLITIIEKTYCHDRIARKQFRRDVVDRGFIHASLMNRFLTERGALEAVLKINPEKAAKKDYKLQRKLLRKQKISKKIMQEMNSNKG